MLLCTSCSYSIVRACSVVDLAIVLTCASYFATVASRGAENVHSLVLLIVLFDNGEKAFTGERTQYQ